MSRRSIAAWTLILAVWGCQSTPSEPDTAPDPVDRPQGAPRTLLDEAQRASGARGARLYLEAAEGFLSQDDFDAAASALDAVAADQLRPRETARFLLAQASIALQRGDLETARGALLALDAGLLEDPVRAALAMAALLHAEGNSAAAAESLMHFQLDVEAPAATSKKTAETYQSINDAIWQYLSHTTPFQVLERETSETGAPRRWWQLKALMLRSFTLAEQRRALQAWQETNPEHPAALHPPAVLIDLSQATVAITRVGLMVPLTGPLNRAGRAVRDAFIATYLEHRDDVDFEVLVYDTAAEPIGTLYERALVNGANVLVGPLDKDAVAQINALNPDIPVIALNYLGDETPAANLLQIGLAIEDEAATLEKWLTDVDAQRVLLLHNDEDWAQRSIKVLAATPRAELTIQPVENIRTVTESVGVAMHVAQSQERHAALEAVLREKLEFAPRARGDLEAIVALVGPLEASALVPALRFHFADRIPVYATSQTVRGADDSRLKELEGFHISELPWFAMQPASYRALNAAFRLEGSPFASLYALGVDAFLLVERAPLILDGGFTELLGSTGELKSSPDGRIQRRLARARLQNGKLVTGSAASGR